MPSHVFSFLSQMMTLASVDPFDGAALYSKFFTFKPTEPVSKNFSYFDIVDSNFIMNSGSFFLMIIAIVASTIISYICNGIALRSYRFSICRKIGVRTFSESYVK